MKQNKQQPTLWLGRYPILHTEHANALNQDAALNEFHLKMPREIAEATAHANYLKAHHTSAAAHHYAGMQTAHAAGQTEDALKHYRHYAEHMKKLGQDHMAPVPQEIKDRLQMEGAKKLYSFKAHDADHLVPQKDESATLKSERLASVYRLATTVLELEGMKKLMKNIKKDINTIERLNNIYKAATQVLELKKAAKSDDTEYGDDGKPRFSTPDELVKTGQQESWESADGLRIPKSSSPDRKRWNQAFMEKLKSVFDVAPTTVKVPVAALIQRNPPVNRDRLDFYTNMLAAGDELPPIVVERHGPDQWYVVDGNHRMNAAKLKGHKELDAVIQEPRQKTR